MKHFIGRFLAKFQIFILITYYLVFCLKDQTFVVTAQKVCTKGYDRIKPSLLYFKFLGSFYSGYHFYSIFVTENITFYGIEISQLHSIIILCFYNVEWLLIFLILTFEHERLFENNVTVNRSSMKIFYYVFHKSNAFVTVFNSSAALKICTTAPFGEILRHVEVSFLTLNENQLTSFSMMRVFTEGCLRADVH